MGMALVLTSKIRFRSFWTGVLLIPWVAPTVVSALNFLWIYDYSLGVLNYLLVHVLRRPPARGGLAQRARHRDGLGHRGQRRGAASRSSASASWPA